jgi:hypothetical protein
MVDQVMIGRLQRSMLGVGEALEDEEDGVEVVDEGEGDSVEELTSALVLDELEFATEVEDSVDD